MPQTKLEIIFAPKNFYVDEAVLDNLDIFEARRIKNFLDDKFQALYKSTAGGIPPLKIKQRIEHLESGRPEMSSFINSSLVAQSKSESTCLFLRQPKLHLPKQQKLS